MSEKIELSMEDLIRMAAPVLTESEREMIVRFAMAALERATDERIAQEIAAELYGKGRGRP